MNKYDHYIKINIIITKTLIIRWVRIWMDERQHKFTIALTIFVHSGVFIWSNGNCQHIGEISDG